MTAEQIAQLKAKNGERGPEFSAGFATALAHVSRRLQEDRRACADIAGSEQLSEYLATMALELADDSEALRS